MTTIRETRISDARLAGLIDVYEQEIVPSALDLPDNDAAIFADTQASPKEVVEVCSALRELRDLRADRDALKARNGLASKESTGISSNHWTDAERLNFLEAQRKWGDCFAIQHLDSGDVYVRPWRYALQSMELLAAPIVAQTLRETIDAALAAQEPT
jgi:hypothetical protein